MPDEFLKGMEEEIVDSYIKRLSEIVAEHYSDSSIVSDMSRMMEDAKSTYARMY